MSMQTFYIFFFLFSNNFGQITVIKCICNFLTLIDLFPIIFAFTNYHIFFSSHRSFITIQWSKNQNLKTKITQITNLLTFLFPPSPEGPQRGRIWSDSLFSLMEFCVIEKVALYLIDYLWTKNAQGIFFFSGWWSCSPLAHKG
jgi:hypothetical protein